MVRESYPLKYCVYFTVREHLEPVVKIAVQHYSSAVAWRVAVLGSCRADAVGVILPAKADRRTVSGHVISADAGAAKAAGRGDISSRYRDIGTAAVRIIGVASADTRAAYAAGRGNCTAVDRDTTYPAVRTADTRSQIAAGRGDNAAVDRDYITIIDTITADTGFTLIYIIYEQRACAAALTVDGQAVALIDRNAIFGGQLCAVAEDQLNIILTDDTVPYLRIGCDRVLAYCQISGVGRQFLYAICGLRNAVFVDVIN